MVEYAYFFLRLPVEAFLVAYHFESDVLVGLVVVRLDDLSEATLPDDFEHFVPVSDVVVWDVNVGTLLVVVFAIIGVSDHSGPFLGVDSDEVDLRIVEDLEVFVRRQFVHVELHDLFGCRNKGFRLFRRRPLAAGDVVHLRAGRRQGGTAALHLPDDGVVRDAHQMCDRVRRRLHVLADFGQALSDRYGHPDGGRARWTLFFQHRLKRWQIRVILDIIVGW